MEYPKKVYVISSWTELEDGLSQKVVGAAYSEDSARRACQIYGRVRSNEDLADDEDDEPTPLVWSEKDVDGRVALMYGDSGIATCFYEEMDPLTDLEVQDREERFERAG